MGLITRHAGAPFANGETLEGPDLEGDIAGVYALVNGNIENVNIKSGADIDGSKLKTNSINGTKLLDASVDASAKLTDDSVTAAKMADDSVELSSMATLAGGDGDVIDESSISGTGAVTTKGFELKTTSRVLVFCRMTTTGLTTMRLKRINPDTSETEVKTWAYNSAQSGVYVDAPAAAGTHTYRFDTTSSSGGIDAIFIVIH